MKCIKKARQTINDQKSEEIREIRNSKFDPAGFEPTHVPDKGLQ